MIRRTTKGLNHTIYLYNLIFIIKRLVQNLLMLFKYCNLTFFNCVLCLGESLTFSPRYFLNCQTTGGASKRYLWVEKIVKESVRNICVFLPYLN